MSRRIVLSWVFLTLMGTAASAQIPISRDMLPTRTALGRVGLERHWMAAVPLGPTEKLIEISMADGLLFAQTDNAAFHTFDAESGQRLWSTHLDHPAADVFPASANSRLVFVSNSNFLFALDRNTGRRVWVENLSILPSSPTSCDEERVMIGLSSGLLRAFSLYKHDQKGLVEKDSAGRPILADRAQFAWNWQTNGPVTSTPVPAGRLVVFGGTDGRAYVALSESPKMVYRIAAEGPIEAPISTFGTRTFLVPSLDKNVYAVDLFTAAVAWTFASGAPVRLEPLVAGADALVANQAGTLTAVEIQTGSPRWSTRTHGGRIMAVSPKRIYLESHDDDLFVVDRATGQTIFDPRSTYSRAGLNLRAYDLSLTNTLNDRLYIASKKGLIYSLREIGQTQPQPLRDPKAPKFGAIAGQAASMEPPVGGAKSSSLLKPTEELEEAKPAEPAEEPAPKPDEEADSEDKSA